MLEVNPTPNYHLAPSPFDAHAHARTHMVVAPHSPQTPSSYRSSCSIMEHSPLTTSRPSPPRHLSHLSHLSSHCHLTTSTLALTSSRSRHSEREELTLTTSTRTPPRHQTSPRLSPTTPLHTSHAPPPCSVRHVFRVRHAAHRRAPRQRGRQRAAAPAAGDRRGLGIPYASAGMQSSPFFTGQPDAQ